MTDEKYVFISDVREKKRTASGAFHKRTHAGKGGAVKFPSDFMTKKELKAMNGEVKAYRLNEPMSWAEFKYMPDDIKISYVKLIRERFKVSDSCIAKMLGVSQNSFSNLVRRLGIGLGRGTGNQKSDKEGFLAWCNGAPITAHSTVEDVEKGLASMEDIAESVLIPAPEIKTLPGRDANTKAIPCSGNMTFVGSVDAALDTLKMILGGASVKITVAWDALAEGCVADG